jgi:hypothetical protein
MELTGGAANRTMGGDEKSECMREEVGGGCSVRVERLLRPLVCVDLVDVVELGEV